MVHPNCPSCQQNQYVIKAGLNRSSSQRYRCQDCARYFTPQPKPMDYEPQTRKQAVQLYLEDTSYRAVGRLLSVHNQSIINWVEAEQKLLPLQVSEQAPTDYLEVDELFSFVKAKKRVYVVNCSEGISIYQDLVWPGEGEHLLSIKKERTSTIESINAQLRTYLARLKRKSRCFSRSLEVLWQSIRFLGTPQFHTSLYIYFRLLNSSNLQFCKTGLQLDPVQ